MLDELSMMTFQEQLEEYPAIKDMLKKNIRNPARLVNPGKTWVVYGQKRSGSKWGRRSFITYKEAFLFFKPRINTYHDISITSTRQAFRPPGRVVRIKRHGEPVMINTANGPQQKTKIVPVSPPPGHYWCMYCRRFTIFTWFTRHHVFQGQWAEMMNPADRRCSICGIREVKGAWRR